jgi:hypothetical protein
MTNKTKPEHFFFTFDAAIRSLKTKQTKRSEIINSTNSHTSLAIFTAILRSPVRLKNKNMPQTNKTVSEQGTEQRQRAFHSYSHR